MKCGIRICIVLLGLTLSGARGASLASCVNAPQLTWTSGGTASWFAQTNQSHDGIDSAQSGAITDGQESWIETQITGPGILTYWWKVSSEQDFDFLVFSLNSEVQTRISGSNDWQLGFFPVPAGTFAARWSYVKDPSWGDGTDAGWLDQVSFQPTFPLATGIDAPSATVISGGNDPFFSETNITHDGANAVQSGTIGDGEISTMNITITGPATISFWWKVSSEENYDLMSFYVGGVLKKQISGEVDWAKETFSVPAGGQTLSWQYSKDSSARGGQDAGWVDQVNLGGAGAAPGFSLSGGLQGNNSFVLKLTGAAPGTSYQIQTSSNLTSWAPWAQLTATNSQLSVTDSFNAATSARFYRAVSP